MPQDRYPVRRGAPLERAESHIDRRSGLVDPPQERRKRRNLELAPQVINQTPDIAGAVGAHDHSGVYSPVGHTHTSGSITDFTEAAQDAIGALIADSASIDATYNDAGNIETLELALTDGVTAPATVAGKAFIYVDSADGDLKVKFGDGTVKTIVVDT